jgi:hypothetical protein
MLGGNSIKWCDIHIMQIKIIQLILTFRGDIHTNTHVYDTALTKTKKVHYVRSSCAFRDLC